MLLKASPSTDHPSHFQTDSPLAEDGSKPTRRIAVLALGRQTLREDILENGAGIATPDEADTGLWDYRLTTSVRTCASIPDLLRAVSTAEDDYLVFSRRPGLIWDKELLRRVAREIAAVEMLNTPWLCLSADGVAIDEARYVSAFFDREPSLLPDRGRRLVVHSDATLCVIKSATLRSLGLRPNIPSDPVRFLNGIISVAYARGFGTFFTSGLFPCFAEHRSIPYVALGQELATLSPELLLDPVEAVDYFPPGISLQELLTAWVGSLAVALRTKHAFSFVIRTLFKRDHMLRRCLISIEYLRSTLDIPVEIVIASDADESLIAARIRELKSDFPNFTFVVAHGNRAPGRRSRVRNLVAGIGATTGTRVCIIDDDDYYAPQAVGTFMQALEFGTEPLIIFDTQIIEEKWLAASVKHHREITGYGQRFDAWNWANTLRASNSIPLCGIIHPGWFVRQVVEEYTYDFDLSEDFVFHVLCLTHPKRPGIKTIDGVAAYQSHRSGDDNVSNAHDRTDWVTDTGNGLFQLLFESGRTFDVISAAEVAKGDLAAQARFVVLEAELTRARRGEAEATRALAGLVARLRDTREGS